MKTNKIYKNTVLIIIVSFISLFITVEVSNAQEVDEYTGIKPKEKRPMEFSGLKSALIGVDNTFIKIEQNGYFVVYNRKNTLIHTYSSYQDYLESDPNPREFIQFDGVLLDSLVKDNLLQYLKNVTNDYLTVNLYSDKNGIIKEIVISYPQRANIPTTAIEKFEKDVLNGQLKLSFDPKLMYFKDATWVETYRMYDLDKK